MPGDEAFVQLDLFTPQRLDLGEAWDALASLAAERAARLFSVLVARYPDSREARDGQRIAAHWRQVLARAQTMPLPARVPALWTALSECPDELISPRLHRSLLDHLWTAMNEGGMSFVPPDLPAGRIALALGRAAEATASLSRAFRNHPDEPAVLRWLASAEWALGHRQAARAVWARLLLAAPETVEAEAIDDEAVRHVIAEHGAALAPLFGWIEGVLPLLPRAPDRGGGTPERLIYASLVEAERARRAGDHEAVIAARLALRDQAPEALAAYMGHLDITPP